MMTSVHVKRIQRLIVELNLFKTHDSTEAEISYQRVATRFYLKSSHLIDYNANVHVPLRNPVSNKHKCFFQIRQHTIQLKVYTPVVFDQKQ